MTARLTLTLAVCAAAAAAGWGLRRNLDTLHYRRPDELDASPPAPRAWAPLVTAAAAGALAWAFLPGRWPVLLILTPVVVGGVWLCAVDHDIHRLPDAVLLPLIGWAAASITVVALVTPHVSILAAAAGAAALGGFFAAMNLLTAGQLGLGDVKAAVLLGGLVGSLSLPHVWWTGMLAFLGALTSAALRRSRDDIALGPWLFGSAVIVALTL